MARLYSGTAGGRTLDQSEFAAFNADFRPNRLFRIAVTGSAITTGNGLAIQLKEGDVIWLPETALGRVDFAGEPAICQAILVNDGGNPANATNLAAATLEIGYIKDDSWLDNAQTKA